jgi:integrase
VEYSCGAVFIHSLRQQLLLRSIQSSSLVWRDCLHQWHGRDVRQRCSRCGSRPTPQTFEDFQKVALRPRIGTGELVFSHDGIPWDPDSLTKAFDRLVEETGVRRITFHGLRHTHISHQLMDGVHVKVVSERTGHANVSITLSVYAAFVPTLQADAAAGVDSWLRENLAEQVGDKSVTIRALSPKPRRLSY